MENLKDKIALVTGGGSGINLAFVKLLYEAGCKVLIADIALHGMATNWISSLTDSPASIEFERTDVADWAQLEHSFDACVTRFGAVPDIVVPGAGVYEPSSNSFWEDQDLDSTSRYKILDINLVHPIKMTRVAVRRLVEARKSGIIIHVSSIAAQRSSIVTPLYTISKHGVSGLIRSMAPLDELAGIKVVGVAPGYASFITLSKKYRYEVC
jgi:3-hydroxybutyrate dehydrogenase